MRVRFFVGLFLVFCLGSCTVNKDFMFQTDKDFVFDIPDIDSTSIEYKIGVADIMSFDLYTNEGALMLQFTTSDVERIGNLNSGNFLFLVDPEGYVEFPVIGRQYVAGYTIRQLQTKLEEFYAFQFNNPYAIIRITNRRCIVFNGEGGTGFIVPLNNMGVSVIEAIALAGGVSKNGDASQIKIFRRKPDRTHDVYLIDLSTIEGIRYANMSVQSGDIIYVQKNPLIAREILSDVQPVISILSSIAITYAIVARIF